MHAYSAANGTEGALARALLCPPQPHVGVAAGVAVQPVVGLGKRILRSFVHAIRDARGWKTDLTILISSLLPPSPEKRVRFRGHGTMGVFTRWRRLDRPFL